MSYLAAIARDAEAMRALGFLAVHGYAEDGVRGGGDDPALWRMWRDGWKSAPEPGLPDDVKGASAYGKKSWMTETSGEPSRWLQADAAPIADSALGLALKIHQALTTGDQSAWLYWQIVEAPSAESLSDATLRGSAPKLSAAKHYFRFIRPGARRVGVKTPSGSALSVSAFHHERDGRLTLVAINPTTDSHEVVFTGLGVHGGVKKNARAWVSRAEALWKEARPARPDAQHMALTLPAQSVTTVVIDSQ